MAYKSLLTIVSDPGVVAQTLAAAISVTRREDAHLEVLCLGIDHTEIGYSYPGVGTVILQDDIAALNRTSRHWKHLSRRN